MRRSSSDVARIRRPLGPYEITAQLAAGGMGERAPG
jgi:hypothetical protein